MSLLALAAAFVQIARSRLPAPVARPAAPPPAESLVYTADDGANSGFWLVDADHPSRRRLLANVPHADGWSGGATVAPDGKTIAYTLLGRGQSDPDHDAQLWLLDAAKARSTLLASGVDLRSPIVWSPGSDSIIYESVDAGRTQLWNHAVVGGVARLIAEPPNGTVVLPFAYVAGGSLVAARFGPSGTDLIRVGLTGTEEEMAHLSDGAARDFALSPDGERVGFLYVDQASGAPLSRGAELDLRTDEISPIPGDWSETVGIAWTPNGHLVTGSAGASAGLRDEAGNRIGPAIESGFEQPLGWSSSGHFLAIRQFSGNSGNDPGSASDLVLNPDGSTFALSTGRPVRFVGWMAMPAGQG